MTTRICCACVSSGKDPTITAADIDMLTVGLPCQSFSGANPRNNDTSLRRNSVDGGEGPSELQTELPAGRMLFEDFLRIVELVRPCFIVLEEVIEILTLVRAHAFVPYASV
jgi:site-specific DNA-cytosine methylase